MLGNEAIDAAQLRRWLSVRMELTRATRRRPGEPVRFTASEPDSTACPRHRTSRTNPLSPAPTTSD